MEALDDFIISDNPITACWVVLSILWIWVFFSWSNSQTVEQPIKQTWAEMSESIKSLLSQETDWICTARVRQLIKWDTLDANEVLKFYFDLIRGEWQSDDFYISCAESIVQIWDVMNYFIALSIKWKPNLYYQKLLNALLKEWTKAQLIYALNESQPDYKVNPIASWNANYYLEISKVLLEKHRSTEWYLITLDKMTKSSEKLFSSEKANQIFYFGIVRSVLRRHEEFGIPKKDLARFLVFEWMSDQYYVSFVKAVYHWNDKNLILEQILQAMEDKGQTSQEIAALFTK